jgi:hypothetical protein
MTEIFSEYVGLTAEAVSLIEGLRADARESKSQILVRILAPLQNSNSEIADDSPERSKAIEYMDYGEGIRIAIGEPLLLFLSLREKDPRKPDAHGEIRRDGFYLDGNKIGPSHKRQFAPAMHFIQKKKQHRNPSGDLVSLSAMRQWHVIRDGELRSLEDIKDPKIARKRDGGRKYKNINLDDLKFDL